MNRRAASHSFGQDELIDIDINRLRDEFRSLRRQRRVSQADVAGLLKVSQATISSFEQGKHAQVRSKTLLQIHRMVSFWKQGKTSASEAPTLRRSVVSLGGPQVGARSNCSRCGNPVPALETPVVYCPACGTTLVSDCMCGHAAHDAAASYCNRCGRPLEGAERNGRVALTDNAREALLQSLRSWIEHDPQIGDLLKEIHEDSQDTEAK